MNNSLICRNLARSVFIAFPMMILCSDVQGRQVLQGNIDTGGQDIIGDQGSSKFTEYRTLPHGTVVNKLSMSFMNDNYNNVFSVWGLNVGQQDQRFVALVRQAGKLQLQLNWDQIPHNHTNTAKTIYNQTLNGILEIPRDVRARLRTILSTDIDPNIHGTQYDTTALINLVNGMARGVDMKSQRDQSKTSFRYSTTDGLDFKLDYANERRSGKKPLGSVFFYHTPAELLEPIDYRTQEGNAQLEYATKIWNARLSYGISAFNNNIETLVWDNPVRETDAIGAASRARLTLSPDNIAHRFGFSGGINLPFSTRITTSMQRDVRRQNEGFVPFTINTAIASLSALPALPAQTLSGRVGVTLVNLFLTNRFISPLWFSARYRMLDYDNQTPSLLLSGYVDQDNLISQTSRRSLPFGYKKTNVSADLKFRPVDHVSINTGYERENWALEYREANNTYENIYKISIDYTLRSILLLRSSYFFGNKKVNEYNYQNVEVETFPAGRPAFTVGQLPQLRKFDISSRRRNRANLMAQIMPLQELTLVGSFGLIDDIFPESSEPENTFLYGLLWNKANNYSGDLTYSPSMDFSLTGTYARENYDYGMRSRQRLFRNDTTDNDWSSGLHDRVNSYGLSISWAVEPEQIELSGSFTLSDANGTSTTTVLGDPGVQSFLVKTGENYPETRSILRQLSIVVRYHLMDHFTPRIEYRFEGYSESYFYQDMMKPYMISVEPGRPGAVYLGVRQPGYAAHFIYLGLACEL